MDEEVFDEPYGFRPDRWIKNPNLPQPGFGFGGALAGASMSPGTHYPSILLRFLWASDIGHAIEDGKDLPIDSMAMTQGFNSQPSFQSFFQNSRSGKELVVDKAWADGCAK
jgi:hypothetical protein